MRGEVSGVFGGAGRALEGDGIVKSRKAMIPGNPWGRYRFGLEAGQYP